jgi:hypothetical protein
MTTRDVYNYLGVKVGTLTLPVETTEEQWTEKLALYQLPPPSAAEIQASYLKRTIVERKAYAEDLLERLKARNISQGINALQGMWMHSRMRALPITFMGVATTQDIMNMAVSGDIEIACLTLQNATPDDMSMPYHWWSQDRINWLITDMKAYLGWT